MNPPDDNARPPLASQLLYAAGSMGSQLLLQTISAWLVYFYAPPIDADRTSFLPLTAVGAILGLGRIVDGITDPLVGYWTDMTRSRWGRRIPFIVAGAPFMAITFVLLWLPPVDGESAVNGIWLLFMIQFYFFFVTIVGSPYTAILPELARRSEDRVAVSAWQLGFGMVGAAIALVATGPLIRLLDFQVMAIAMAGLGMAARYVGLLGVMGRLRYVPPETRPSLAAALRTTFTNRYFLAFMPSLMGFNAAVLMLTQTIPFFVTAVLEKTEAFVSVLTGTVMGVALVFAPASVWLANRFGKRRVYGWGLLAFACTLPLLSVAGLIPGVPRLLQTVVIVSVIGLPLGAVFILPDALLSDITDYDEGRSGTRREAMFFGTRATLEKMALAIASPLFAGLLDLFGSTHDDPLGIRLVGPVAAVLAFAGYTVFSIGYRLPDRPGGDT